MLLNDFWNWIKRSFNYREFALFITVSISAIIFSTTAISLFNAKGKINKYSNILIDSLEKKKSFEEEFRIEYEMQKYIRENQLVTDTIYFVYVDSTDSYTALNNRVKIIEEGLGDNPERILSILSINNEIKILNNNLISQKEYYQLYIDTINEKIAILYTLFGGVLVTFIGGVLIWWMQNFKKK